MNLLKIAEVAAQLDQMQLFLENMGADLDLQHGLIAELEAKRASIDYKDVLGHKANATQLSKLRRELRQLEHTYSSLSYDIEKIEDESKPKDVVEETKKDIAEAIIKMKLVYGDPEIRQLIKDFTAEILSSTFDALKAADFVTKIQLVSSEVTS